jgi:hypothetical protein
LLETMSEGLKDVGRIRFDYPEKMKFERAMTEAFGLFGSNVLMTESSPMRIGSGVGFDDQDMAGLVRQYSVRS